MNLIQALAQKEYYKKLAKNIEEKLAILKLLYKSYESDIDAVYDNLPIEKKNLILPIIPTIKEKIINWEKESVTNYDEYPDSLHFHTQRGELVRSKSEIMIADYLYKNSDIVDYRYEQELTLTERGEEITVHPDFKIINLKTGRIVYWEHAGKMDDMKYVNGFMNKINLYSSNGYVIGKDVIVTYENYMYPLDTLQIRQAMSLIV